MKNFSLIIFIGIVTSLFAVDNVFGEEPTLVVDPVIDQGKIIIYYKFYNMPEEPDFGYMKYILQVNNKNYNIGVNSDGFGKISTNTNISMNIGGLITGPNVYEKFDQKMYYAHYGIPYLIEPTPNIYCGKPISFYPNIIKGTNGDDYLIGTDGDDLIFGFDGNDFIKGNNGIDCLVGGLGSDIFYSERDDKLDPVNIMSDGSDLCIDRKQKIINKC